MNLVMRKRIGVAVWCVGALIAVTAGSMRSSSFEASGMGFAPPVSISSLESGRLLALDVKLHDAVSAADVVARFDPATLDAEREVVSAELLAMQEEQTLAAAHGARRFAEGIEDGLLDRARLASDVRADQALILSLSEQLAVEQGLREKGASSNEQVRKIERKLEVAQARLDGNALALGQARQSNGSARQRGADAPLANPWLVVAATRRLEQVEARIADLELAASIDGQVTAILHQPGEVVQPGQPILEITQTSTDEVLAWLPSAATSEFLAGATAKVVRPSGQILDGELVSVGSGPQPMPAQLWHNPSYPEWGVPVRIQLTDGRVGPQEPVRIRL